MGKINLIQNFLFLQGVLLFIIHFIFSPYPLNSLKKFNDSIKRYIKEYKIKNEIIKREKIFEEKGYNFKIISTRTKRGYQNYKRKVFYCSGAIYRTRIKKDNRQNKK